MRSGADVEMHPQELDNKQITRLHQLLHEAKFKDPDGSHLSPAGEAGLKGRKFFCLHLLHCQIACHCGIVLVNRSGTKKARLQARC